MAAVGAHRVALAGAGASRFCCLVFCPLFASGWAVVRVPAGVGLFSFLAVLSASPQGSFPALRWFLRRAAAFAAAAGPSRPASARLSAVSLAVVGPRLIPRSLVRSRRTSAHTPWAGLATVHRPGLQPFQGSKKPQAFPWGSLWGVFQFPVRSRWGL